MFGGNYNIPSMGPAFSQYGNRLHDLAGQMHPYSNMGMGALNNMQQQMSSLWQHPNQLQDRIASGFHTSPYQQNMMGNLSHLMNANAAQTGMLGSQSGNQALQDHLANMMGQFQNQYVQRGMQSAYNAFPLEKYLGTLGYNAFGKGIGLNQQSAYTPVASGLADQGANIARMRAEGQDRYNDFGLIGGLGKTAAGFFSGGLL